MLLMRKKGLMKSAWHGNQVTYTHTQSVWHGNQVTYTHTLSDMGNLMHKLVNDKSGMFDLFL